MRVKDKIDIKAKRHHEFSSMFEIDGNKYTIQTENLGPKSCKIVTNTYLKGAIISSLSSNYSAFAGTTDLQQKIQNMMESQHASVVSSLTSKKKEPVKSKALFADEMKRALKVKDLKTAFDTVSRALRLYPVDPYFLSYCGYLTAAVEKRRIKEGCGLCQEAIKVLGRLTSSDKDFFYPILHLNLGRTYLLCRKKKAALESFYEGLKYDIRNEELHAEIRRMGIRKPPAISFLDREHPLNKFLGKLRHKMKSK